MAWAKTNPANDELLINFPAQCRANWDALELGTENALQITNAKVADAAGITDGKLAQIVTPGKVSGAALTLLGNIPGGAGLVPVANVPNLSTDKLTSGTLPIARGGTGSGTQNFVDLTEGQSVGGIKTFTSIPILPASNPTTDNQAVRKLYADTKISKSTANEIAVITEKVTPADNDVFLIEDSADSWNKKRVKKSSIASAPTGLGPVVFSFGSGNDRGDNTSSWYGAYLTTSITPPPSTNGGIFCWGNAGPNGHAHVTVIRSKFKKISNISTVTCYALFALTGEFGTVTGNCEITIAGASALTLSTTTKSTLLWLNGTIDVSGLTNGTVYDLTVVLYGSASTVATALHNLIGFAS
jgi:hypothetical protein